MKTLLLSVMVLTGPSFNLFADLLTYRFAGAVVGESTAGRFAVGRPYTLNVTIDTVAPGVPSTPERADYPAAITLSVFDYDSGSYIARGTNTGTVSILNNDRGLYDHFEIVALAGFAPVGGQSYSGSFLHLIDSTATAFATAELPRNLNAEAFQTRDFSITWGIDLQTLWLSLSVDSIALIQRRPEITSCCKTDHTFALTIEFPSKQYTNLLERSSELGPSAQWEAVCSFITLGGNTNWPMPLLTERAAVFYRVRG